MSYTLFNRYFESERDFSTKESALEYIHSCRNYSRFPLYLYWLDSVYDSSIIKDNGSEKIIIKEITENETLCDN